MAQVSILGVPFSGGQRRPGTEEAPALFRKAGLLDRISASGYTISDHGDLEIEYESFKNAENHGNLRNNLLCGDMNQRLCEKVQAICNNKSICINLGGDHSMGTGTIAGMAASHKSISVLWIDAHADLNTQWTTPSGNMHGMPVSFLLKGIAEQQKVPGYEWVKPCLAPSDIAYIGLRDVDPGEYEIIRKLGIKAFSMYDIEKYGMSSIIDMALRAVNPGMKKPIHVSFDVDALDPSITPSTGTPVPAGITLREAILLGLEVHKTGLLAGLDIVEVNPMLGDKKDVAMTVNASLDLIDAFLGKHPAGYWIGSSSRL